MDLKKDDFVSLSMSNDIDCKSFKWGFLAQRYISYILRYIRWNKTFPPGSISKKNRIGRMYKDTNERKGGIEWIKWINSWGSK